MPGRLTIPAFCGLAIQTFEDEGQSGDIWRSQLQPLSKKFIHPERRVQIQRKDVMGKPRSEKLSIVTKVFRPGSIRQNQPLYIDRTFEPATLQPAVDHKTLGFLKAGQSKVTSRFPLLPIIFAVHHLLRRNASNGGKINRSPYDSSPEL